MKNKIKSVKKTKRISQKGKYGKVGAPPKKVNWPRSAFTMATLFNCNSKGGNAQCELSLRTKVAEGLVDKTILALMPKKQPGGAVGRPKSVFVCKEHFVPSKHELLVKTVRVLRPAKKVELLAVVPAQIAVPVSPAPVIAEVPAVPAPAIETVCLHACPDIP